MAMVINQYTIETTDTDKEYSIKDGAVFLGCELVQHQVIVWVAEPVEAVGVHNVWMTCIPEHGSYGDGWQYVGFCANRVFAEDETFHVVAHCETMEIRTTPPELNIANFVGGLAAKIEELQGQNADLSKKIEALGKKLNRANATQKKEATK